jgi:predicted RNA binding protein YcfA (HicA-like mRNA interferase family)
VTAWGATLAELRGLRDIDESGNVVYLYTQWWGEPVTSSRDIIKRLKDDGWEQIGATGSHHHYKHPNKPGKVTIPHPVKDLPKGTVRSIEKQAGWR